MASHCENFVCTNCGWHNYPVLRENFHGNYTIRCGHCSHDHYRVIKNGVVTEDRHNKNMPAAEIIHVMPSACSEKPRELGTIARLRSMAAAGLMK